jgi:hypothetical protein
MRTNRFLLFANHYGKDIGKYLFFNQSETGKLFSPVGDEQTFGSAIFVGKFFQVYGKEILQCYTVVYTHTHVCALCGFAVLRA